MRGCVCVELSGFRPHDAIRGGETAISVYNSTGSDHVLI
jgi:hypothetical protein